MNQLDSYIKDFLLNSTFNNIEILLSNCAVLKLDEESLHSKIVKRNRGGYCFENNQYFYNFLIAKDYKVSRKLGRVVYGETRAITARTHQISIVEIDKESFLVDVGFGPYTPCGLIPLDGNEVETFNRKIYRISKLNDFDYQLEIKKGESYFSLYQFNLIEYNDADFKLSNYYTNTHDDSKFTKSLILSQQVENGTRFISNLVFTEVNGDTRVDRDLKSSNEMTDVITKYFNISLSEDECLKLFEIVRNF